jgi:hypothetical protein
MLGEFGDLLDDFLVMLQFLEIAPFEFRPFGGVMPKPGSQRLARGNILQPEIDAGPFHSPYETGQSRLGVCARGGGQPPNGQLGGR